MALTVSDLSGSIDDGFRRKRTATVTFDASYLTGGEVLSADAMGMPYFDELELESPVKDFKSFDITVAADRLSATLLVVDLTTGAEIGGATDLSALAVKVIATGGV